MSVDAYCLSLEASLVASVWLPSGTRLKGRRIGRNLQLDKQYFKSTGKPILVSAIQVAAALFSLYKRKLSHRAAKNRDSRSSKTGTSSRLA